MYEAENSLSRVTLFMNLSMVSFESKVTWLDEIAEALKNCANAMNHFISMSHNFPVSRQSADDFLKKNTLLPKVITMLRQVCYGLGRVSCQLIQRNFGAGEDAESSLK